MKKFIKAILTIGFIIGFVAMMGESSDKSIQYIWTFGWMAEMLLCGWGLVKLFPNDFKEDVA